LRYSETYATWRSEQRTSTAAGRWGARHGTTTPVDCEDGDRLLVLGLGILAVGLTATSLADGTVVAVASMLVFGVGFGLVFPAATGITSLLAGPQARGRGFGLFNAAFSVGLAFGVVLLAGTRRRGSLRRRGQRGDQPPTSSRSDGPARRRRR
jgi:MFS family permease